jgi:hypothetical protein
VATNNEVQRTMISFLYVSAYMLMILFFIFFLLQGVDIYDGSGNGSLFYTRISVTSCVSSGAVEGMI